MRLGLPAALVEDEDRVDLLWGLTVIHLMVMKLNPQACHASRLSLCPSRMCPAVCQVLALRRASRAGSTESTFRLILSLLGASTCPCLPGSLQRALPLLHSKFKHCRKMIQHLAKSCRCSRDYFEHIGAALGSDGVLRSLHFSMCQPQSTQGCGTQPWDSPTHC